MNYQQDDDLNFDFFFNEEDDVFEEDMIQMPETASSEDQSQGFSERITITMSSEMVLLIDKQLEQESDETRSSLIRESIARYLDHMNSDEEVNMTQLGQLVQEVTQQRIIFEDKLKQMREDFQKDSRNGNYLMAMVLHIASRNLADKGEHTIDESLKDAISWAIRHTPKLQDYLDRIVSDEGQKPEGES